VTDDKKFDDLRLRFSQNQDFRLSGPLPTPHTQSSTAESLATANDAVSATAAVPERISTLARSRYTELLTEFCLQIGLSELPIDEDTSCSINIGENTNNPMLITMQLQATETKEQIVFFSNIHHYPQGVSEEIVLRLEAINETLSANYYLSHSEHYVFLCAEKPVLQITGTQFTNFVEEFYRQAVGWAERYLSVIAGNEVAEDAATTPNIAERPTITRGLKV
jgi:hypothetical protein